MFAGIAHPYVIASILIDPDFLSWSQFSDADKGKQGFVGEFGGVKWLPSTNMILTKSCLTVGSMTTATFSLALSLIVGPDAFGVTEIEGMGGYQMFVKRPNEFDTSNPINQYSTVGSKITMAATVLNAKRGYFLATFITGLN